MPILEFAGKAPHARVLVEVESGPNREGIVRASRGGAAILEVQKTFEEALAPLESIAHAVEAALAGLHPREIEVSLGLKITVEGNLVVVKGSGEANLQIKLIWKERSVG